MNVTDQLEEIGIFLAQDRLVPILEEMPMSPVTAVVGDSVAREKPPHHSGDGGPARPKQEMNVIREQHPTIAGSTGLRKNASHPIDKLISILVILEDFSALDPSYNDVMQSTGSVNAGLAGHAVKLAKDSLFVNLYFYGRPHGLGAFFRKYELQEA